MSLRYLVVNLRGVATGLVKLPNDGICVTGDCDENDVTLRSGVSNNVQLAVLGTRSENALDGVTIGAGRKIEDLFDSRLIVGGSMSEAEL